MKTVDQYALWAVTLSALFAIEFAAHTRPRLATALRFFALSWAVLLPFYALQSYLGPDNLRKFPLLGDISEFLPTYSGILLLLTVEPLLREAVHHGTTMDRALKVIDFITERSLYFIVLPHAVFAIGEGHHGIFMRWLDFFLAGAAFFLLAFVFSKLVKGWRRGVWFAFLIVAIVYLGVHTLWTLKHDPNNYQMSDAFKITFATCKLALSATFIPLVMTIPVPQRRLQVWYKERAIAELWYRDDQYVFRYLKTYFKSKCKPLQGLQDVKREYVSKDLFPFFKQHVPTMQDWLAVDRIPVGPYELRLID